MAAEVGDVVRVDRGTWGLKEWYPNVSFGKKDSGKPENGEKADETAEAIAAKIEELVK